MAENSLNLVDMVKGYLTGDMGNKISSLLGESPEKTQTGIDAAIPGLLAGFENTASTPDGARRLTSAVEQSDTGILSNLGSILGKGTGSSSGILQSVLGVGGLSELIGNVGRTSGLSRNGVGTLIGILAPIAMSVLKRVMQSRNLDSAGLSNLLASQKSNIAAAMPEGMRMGEFKEETYPRPAATPPSEARKSGLGWVLPLALLALLGGLLWYGSSRSPVRAGREDAGRAERTERSAASLESLKAKYNSALQSAREEGVQIWSMTEQDGKLVIRGTAPSAEAADRFREQIRSTNPNMDDVIVNLTVGSSR
jgi:hypothetical protein